MQALSPRANTSRTLYTAEERRRRDASGWTLVQGILAPLQFLVFLVSLALVAALPRDRCRPRRRDGLGTRQDPGALRDHGHGLPLGEGRLRPLPVRPGVLLGRRVQHARAGAAHGLPRWPSPSTWLEPRAQMLWRLPPTPPTRSTRPSSCSSCAPPGSTWRAQQPASSGRAHERRHPDPCREAVPTRRCCASAASARCSAD